MTIERERRLGRIISALMMIAGNIVPVVLIHPGDRLFSHLILGTEFTRAHWIVPIVLALIALGLYIGARRMFVTYREEKPKAAVNAVVRGFFLAAVGGLVVGGLVIWLTHSYFWFAGYFIVSTLGNGVALFLMRERNPA